MWKKIKYKFSKLYRDYYENDFLLRQESIILENFEIILKKARELNKNIDKNKDFFEELSRVIIEENKKVVIKNRNDYAINLVEKNMDDKKIWVIVFWKAHNKEFKEQLKEKYNWKVNIYIAK